MGIEDMGIEDLTDRSLPAGVLTQWELVLDLVAVSPTLPLVPLGERACAPRCSPGCPRFASKQRFHVAP
jgi:hypothetical protein